VPKISIIVPVFNGRAFILDALNSILEQSFTDWECILINDGSTDDSREVMESWILHNNLANKFELVNTPNQGVSRSRNLGLELANGEIVAFLDCDDIWERNKLELQHQILCSNPRAVGVVSSFYTVRVNRQKLLKASRLIHHKSHGKLVGGWLSLTGNGALVSSGLLMRRNNLRFNLQLSTTADLEFFVHLSDLGSIKIEPYPLVRYRIHSGQMHLSPEKLIEEYPRLLKILGQHVKVRVIMGNVYAMAGFLALSRKDFLYGFGLMRVSARHSLISLPRIALAIFHKRTSGFFRLYLFNCQQHGKKVKRKISRFLLG
jgi:glycosyltransferase involved in cell wall biosynthesis